MKKKIRFMNLRSTGKSRTNRLFFAAVCSDPSEQSFKESLLYPWLLLLPLTTTITSCLAGHNGAQL